ncbi:hypothetical protein QX776_05300 [Alteromonadaceae bacterium BrNp21-10]|nr:hypothetical protein [Alteromonadaceae bacterium BrNp21-10]
MKNLFVPSDLSGIIAFSKIDYSTTFIQCELSQYPNLVNRKREIDFSVLRGLSESNVNLRVILDELLIKKLIQF